MFFLKIILFAVLCGLIFVPHDALLSLLNIVLLLMLLAVSEGCIKAWKFVAKSWHLLRWLLLPILLLHALFTPGEMLFDTSVVPISYEGMQLGLALGLHLSEIYMLTLFLLRILSIYMCLRWLMRLPYWHSKLTPYLLLMPRIMRDVRVLIRRAYRSWQKKPQRFRALPHHLLDLIEKVQHRSARQALYIWQQWQGSSVNIEAPPMSNWQYKHLIWMLLMAISVACVEWGGAYG